MKKEVVNNPRYPHNIKVVRLADVQTNILDEKDLENEDPFATDMTSNPKTKIEKAEMTIYEGEGRSFTDTTTNGMGKVDINKRKASIPVRYDVWEAGKLPLDGDTIYATVGNNTEEGRVRDCEPDNDRTIIYWELVRV